MQVRLKIKLAGRDGVSLVGEVVDLLEDDARRLLDRNQAQAPELPWPAALPAALAAPVNPPPAPEGSAEGNVEGSHGA